MEEQTVELPEWAWVGPAGPNGAVVRAEYGDGTTMVEVVSIVGAMIGKGASWQVSNDTFGCDPCPGAAKLLRLRLRCEKRPEVETETLEFKEWDSLPGTLAGTLLAATYGNETRRVDVTAAAEALLRGAGPRQVTNDALGCDPCPGASKVLRLDISAAVQCAEFTEWSDVPCSHIAQLVDARWGTAERSVDVFAHVMRHVSGDAASFQASNESLGCDPVPGAQKILRVKYIGKAVGQSSCSACAPERPIGGGCSLIVMVEAWEGERISLPPGSVGAITGCSYGVGASWVDPRGFLEARLEADGALDVLVSNDALGGDPAPGVPKSLRVSYTIHESRRKLADEGEWEIHTAQDVSGDVEFCMSGPAKTEEDLAHARRRCLLLGCGGFRLTTGTVNQFGEEDGPPGCEQLRFTQDLIRASLRPRAAQPHDSRQNAALRPGIHIAPKQFQTDTVWRPGNDAAPAPWIGFRPSGRFCAVATQMCVPPEGVAESTYYMFGGFQCGYGGIQQFSEGKQTITFSVWNAPQGDKAQTVGAGPGATASHFGGEGMGVGVTYDPSGEHVKWTAGTTYTWLLRATPDGEDATVFTAHIFKPEQGWQFIASHRRPDPLAKQQGKLEALGGFLEDAGHTSQRRAAEYGPCWVQRADSSWEAVTQCEAGDGCSRPNKAAGVTEDGRRVRLTAGGSAMPPSEGAIFTPSGFKIHGRFSLKPAQPPGCLASAPGGPPSSGWCTRA